MEHRHLSATWLGDSIFEEGIDWFPASKEISDQFSHLKRVCYGEKFPVITIITFFPSDISNLMPVPASK
jgi:hypothetical protein